GELAKESRMREIRTYGLTRGPRAKALVLLYYFDIEVLPKKSLL
ncbi:hypothetical protein J2S21_004020, partial [Peribacillus cavernae]|nr:hypothetical protein [Peribacillus cavernae]